MHEYDRVMEVEFYESCETCPKCEAAELTEKWSGVECPNPDCDYWFCF